MSLTTWKKEFYRTPANKTSKRYALKHSIKKWTGLLSKNRKKHKIKLHSGTLRDINGNGLEIDDTSCSLCVHYNFSGVDCSNCPLTSVSDDEHPCHKAYAYFMDTNKIAPMIKLLQKAQQKQKGKVK